MPAWWCDGRPDDAKEEISYAIAKEIARKALNRQLTDRIDGALYYHARRVSPRCFLESLRSEELGKTGLRIPRGRFGWISDRELRGYLGWQARHPAVA